MSLGGHLLNKFYYNVQKHVAAESFENIATFLYTIVYCKIF